VFTEAVELTATTTIEHDVSPMITALAS
jgi:hypothetical protein